ncbi:MAG: 3-methylornithyl-N6-L-lysine dehydrogenase PylD [Desulfobacula sp.]|nr:3-methylornithyl-N6-L-lysine dehydrogenase PylD [Desulfobacula sp.]
MTRLKNYDICDISSALEQYDRDLVRKTGRSLLGVACHTCGVDEDEIKRLARSFCIHVVPVNAGQGVIPEFSETVSAIVQFLGFNARVSDKADTAGIALAFESRADAIMMADDHRFVGINLGTRSVADNTEMTGQVYAAVIDLMANGVRGKDVLVMGCGPVGESAARKFLSFGARVSLADEDLSVAQSLGKTLLKFGRPDKIKILKKEEFNGSTHQFVLEATPSENTIPDSILSDNIIVAAPGVPLGVSKKGCRILKDRLVHDKLELGVAAMAVCLLK